MSLGYRTQKGPALFSAGLLALLAFSGAFRSVSTDRSVLVSTFRNALVYKVLIFRTGDGLVVRPNLVVATANRDRNDKESNRD